MRWLLLASASLIVFACQGRERPPPLGLDLGAGGGASDGLNLDDDGDDGEPCEGPPDVDNTCGAEIVPVLQKKPNLYFVLDVSGSMADRMSDGFTTTKLTAAKNSIVSVASELGHRVNYGLGIYPGPDASFEGGGCGTGVQSFETTAGDPILCVNKPPEGPVLSTFTTRVMALKADGGTPLAASLTALTPQIEALDGPTAVILLTDGAPNCNAAATCGPELCAPNIVDEAAGAGFCLGDFNCCDPETMGNPYAGANCVDVDPSVAAVTALSDAGIQTYVIGVPGVEAFAGVMNQLAIAGGTDRPGPLAYYDAADTDALTETLRAIGTEVAQTCSLQLTDPPADPSVFNVYFDAVVIPQDEDNGWTLTGDTVTLNGEACSDVKGGKISQIQMLTGCETVVR